jgi:hypothetical protein
MKQKLKCSQNNLNLEHILHIIVTNKWCWKPFLKILLQTQPYDRLVLVSWGGVRLSPLGTSATNWPIVPAPDGR